MSNLDSCVYCRSAAPKRAIRYSPGSQSFFWCSACGVVSKRFDTDAHQTLAQQHYGFGSWGATFEEHLSKHGPRIDRIVRWAAAVRPIDPEGATLDIGAGTGVLIHTLGSVLGGIPRDMTALEPVPDLARWLAQKFPTITVKEAGIESLPAGTFVDKFSLVFCLGVDYLFRDWEASIVSLKKMIRPGGRLIIARNVFLNMPSYFKGRPIHSFAALVDSNPLISTYMFPEQYAEFLSRHFDIHLADRLEERYIRPAEVADAAVRQSPPTVATRNIAFDCTRSTSEARAPKPVMLAESSLNALALLDAELVP